MSSKINVGDKVAFSKLNGAAWYEVVSIDGYDMEVREYDKPNHRPVYADASLVEQHRKA